MHLLHRAVRLGLVVFAAAVCLAGTSLSVRAGVAGELKAGPRHNDDRGKTAGTVEESPELWRYHRQAPRRPPLFFFLGSGLADPIEQLLDDADAAFRRGADYHRAGHLEHARQEFDRAVDLLLTARFTVRDDPRLLYGLDYLVDRIHQLELAARREAAATDPAERDDVPAAIEEVPPLTFPLDPALRLQVEQELATLVGDLPLVLNERVLSAVNSFSTVKGRRIIEHGLRRAGRYREMITSILADEGLPRDLIYLAQAESAFQPHARSRMRAVGMWQFIRQRGQQYGLKVGWWVDERRDPLKATRAAARHLRDLYQQFGDWYLAMAAFNCGPVCVAKALERGGAGSDYWSLAERKLLPRETRNYVPIIVAVALVAKDPGRYGVVVEPDPPLRYETVKVDKPTDLRRIAEVIGVDVETLRELNPQLLQTVTPPAGEDFELYVPPGSSETLRAELPRLPEAQLALWPRHRVRRGETLGRIARRYRLSTYALAEVNGLAPRSRLHPGDILVIPRGASARRRSRSERGDDGQLVHRVEEGDTLGALAREYGTSAEALARANGLSLRSLLHIGDRLAIPSRNSRLARANAQPARATPRPTAAQNRPVASKKSSTGDRQHRVRSGETLWGLSRRYGVSVAELREANPHLSERKLRAGDRLVIPD